MDHLTRQGTDAMSILAAVAHENPLIPPWGEIIIGLIAFGLVLVVFAQDVAPRLEKVFRARRAASEGGLSGAGGEGSGGGSGGPGAIQAEAKAALEQYRAQLAEARSEAAQ